MRSREPAVTPWPRAGRVALGLLLVGLAGHVGAQLGFALKFPPHHISPFWPTNAILFAVLVMTPVRHWWAYTLAAFASPVVSDAREGFPLGGALFLIADLIEISIAAVGVRRLAGGPRAFASLGNLVVYLLVAAVLAPATSALVGALAGATEGYWFYWRVWFLSDALPYLTLAPAILVWIAGARTRPASVPPARIAEACALGAGLLAVSVVAFGWPIATDEAVPALVYLPLPLLLWAAVRFGPLGVNTALLIVTALSISGTVLGRGPFAGSTPAAHVLELQLFLYTMSVPLLFLAALIEERRERTSVLSESEAWFRAMADTAPVLIWVAGPDKGCTFLNRGWLEFTGRHLAQELGQGWTAGVHPDDVDRCLDTYVRAFDARREFTMEYRLRRHDGEYRVIVDRGVPRYARDGTFLGYIGCADDITERKQGEERPRQVLEAAPNAMIMVDQEGRITLVNAAAEAVFGYSRDQLIGAPIEMLVPERLRVDHSRDRKEYVSDPGVRAMGAGRELFGRRRDGSLVPVEVGLTPLHTSDGLSVLASIVDITARKAAALAAERHRTELAHVGRLSTLGQLATSLAHELNQPLAAILSNAQAAQRLLAATPTDLVEIRQILKDIVYDDNRAGQVIQRLRALVRKEPPVFAALDLDTTLRDVLLLLHSDTIVRSSHVTLTVAPGLPAVWGDRVELQQVTLNLLLNAFEAMRDRPAEERQVTVRAEVDAKGMVKVAVHDRGVGLGDTIERIFQQFYTTKPDGLGMGLSISRSIVEAHGGRLWAENNPEGGATFYFTLSPASAPVASSGEGPT
jgi:PAS domain S-box-containing protein